MTPQMKRLLFPLRAPRLLTLAWWPVHLLNATVDGYFEAFFAALTPPGAEAKARADEALKCR